MIWKMCTHMPRSLERSPISVMVRDESVLARDAAINGGTTAIALYTCKCHMEVECDRKLEEGQKREQEEPLVG